MALKRQEKETFVEALRGDFKKSQHAILVDFRGITVPAVTVGTVLEALALWILVHTA